MMADRTDNFSRLPCPADGLGRATMLGGRWGFSLMEMLVVIGIIVVIISVSMPAFKSIAKGNAQQQGVNIVTSAMATARAQALKLRVPVAAIFYEDTSSKNQTAVMLAQQTSSTPPTFDQILPEWGNPTFLPRGIKVATLNDDVSGVQVEGDAARYCRVVLFDSNGQLIVRNNLHAANATLAALWGISGATAADDTSSPGLIIYDNAAFQGAGGATMTVPTPEQWLRTNGKLLIVNAFTGNVIR